MHAAHGLMVAWPSASGVLVTFDDSGLAPPVPRVAMEREERRRGTRRGVGACSPVPLGVEWDNHSQSNISCSIPFRPTLGVHLSPFNTWVWFQDECPNRILLVQKCRGGSRTSVLSPTAQPSKLFPKQITAGVGMGANLMLSTSLQIGEGPLPPGRLPRGEGETETTRGGRPLGRHVSILS